jgi:2-iminoacetate synthase ThiH
LGTLETLKQRRPLVEGVDFYREGAYVVFTADYHLRRGSCCESGCRHCPFGAESSPDVLHEKDRERDEE